MDRACKMSKQWYLIIDVEKCENCGNCILSCKDEHAGNDWPGYSAPQTDHGQPWIKVHTRERGQFPVIDVAYLCVPCMHCEDGPCMREGQSGAVHRRKDGIVMIDPVRAKGRKDIVSVCPYGAISWNEDLGIPQKCTLCAHLLDDGWSKTRCTQSCPTGALSLHQFDDTEVGRVTAEQHLECYLPQTGTRPHVLYRNLHRFTRCFIAGSVAVRRNSREECAEGAKVVLYNSGGTILAEAVADNYGDFKFDDLGPEGGPYKLTVSLEGYESRTIEVLLTDSRNVGVIFLAQAAA
jgi:Fe-S-cluster-containing dehydrogenase component